MLVNQSRSTVNLIQREKTNKQKTTTIFVPQCKVENLYTGTVRDHLRSGDHLQYCTDFGSTTPYNMNRKPLCLFWLFRPSTTEKTIGYTTTSITFEHVVDNRAERQFTKNTVRGEAGIYQPEKKPVGKKLNRKSGKDPWLMLWKATSTKATRLEGLCPHLFSMYSNKHGQFEIIIRNENK